MPNMSEILQLIGDSLPKPDRSHVGMFVGPQSRTWDPRRAQAAKDMLNDPNVTEEEIWAATQTKWGEEGKLRQEISDQGAQINPSAFPPPGVESDSLQGSEIRQLWEILSHPELEEAYPELFDLLVRIKQKPQQNGLDGYMADVASDTEPHIEMSGPNPESIKSGLLHELQHAIQKIEGFNRGGNPGQFMQLGQSPFEALNSYKRLAGETEARLTQTRANFADKDRARYAPTSDRAGKFGAPDVPGQQQIVIPQAPSHPKTHSQKAIQELLNPSPEIPANYDSGPVPEFYTNPKKVIIEQLINAVIAAGGISSATQLAQFIQSQLDKENEGSPTDILDTIS